MSVVTPFYLFMSSMSSEHGAKLPMNGGKSNINTLCYAVELVILIYVTRIHGTETSM